MRAWLLGVLLLASSCASLRVVPLPAAAERHRARTRDGWELSLVRYRALGEPRGRPVLLCHGIAANERNLDLDDEISMARYLAAHGREAWTLSLRGTGGSDRAAPRDGRPDDYGFEAYYQEDLPAAVALVRQVTGASKVDWVGHSMGGLVAYAHLAQGGEGLGAVATLGSPTRLDFGTRTEGVVAGLGPVLPRAGAIPSAMGALLSAPFQGVVEDGPFQRIFYVPGNTRLDTWQRLMAYGTADVAGGVAQQFISMIRTGRFSTAGGEVDLRAGLARNQVPVLVVAGKLDRIAIVPAVRDGYRALGGPKEWLLVSVANGARAEYGHMDLVVGAYAADDVWTRVLDFLDRHQH